MRKQLLLGIALAIGTSVGALATTVDLGQQSKSHVQGACSGAGGSFWSTPEGQFGCDKKNCDHKGGDCHVWCSGTGSKDGCTGSTPDRVRGKSNVGTVLGNGAAVNRATKKRVPTSKSAAGHRTNTRSPHSSTSHAPGGVTVKGYNGHGGGRGHPKPAVRDHRAKPVLRDHRSPHTSTSNAPGGVTVSGYGHGGGRTNSKPTVRDHRAEPVVRDHR